MKTLEQLRADVKKAVGALEDFEKGIVDDAGEPRDMTQEEFANYEKLTKAVEEAANVMAAKERADKAAAAGAVPADGKSGKLPAEVKDDKLFKTFGEQLQAVINAGINKDRAPDPRLKWQPLVRAAGGNESVPSEGGFLVQTDFSTALMTLMHEMGQILPRVRKIPISGNANGITLPSIDETSRATGSRWGGVRVYWADEGATVDASKPKLKNIELKLNKLMGLAYLTNELMQDAVAIEAIYKQAFAEEMAFTVENSIYSGTGSGQPLGFMNSGALVTITAESAQAAATINADNVLKMMARMPIRSVANSVWLINQDALPQLWKMTIAGAGSHLMYAPPGLTNDMKNAPFGTLMGRPVLPVEYASTLGTVGDIVLVDLSQYLMIDKGGVSASESMHVRFIYDEMAFRITFRVDGQPAWKTALTPFKGSNTLSPYITLETRT